MTDTNEKKMLRDIHSIAQSLAKIAKSMENTIMISTEPSDSPKSAPFVSTENDPGDWI